MTAPKHAISPSSASIAVSYCKGRIRNVSRGIKAMEARIKTLEDRLRILESW